ncbi:carboxymuconolactone decarboxylase family protein [Tabrizicola sp. BL-A-41-H6]|uniref:carboxymuconolactone decarboxylase family protein n=1 Tax=Tabrizicola sp. BL-A-41-H6 TaxID=3421107 RepID=UPI003D678215
MSLRPPVLDEAALSSDQRSVFDAIRSGPRGVVEGPLRVWVQSPELARHAQALGAYCRYGTRLPPRLSELAILIVGADWQSGFEWHVHAPIGLQAGLDPRAIEAIRRGQTPVLDSETDQAVYRFVTELLTTRRVSDTAYADALRLVGLEATVDLVGILGYYTLISMTINAFEVPVPRGAEEPFGPAWTDPEPADAAAFRSPPRVGR